jgi:isoamylase
VDLRQPPVLRLVMDSLRYWVTECHIDGFRFDLVPALCRGDLEYTTQSSFLAAVHADPVLQQVKMIAEPWDIGVGGYQLGAFPAPWAEWNDRYRDDIRDLWRGAPGALRNAAGRIVGSADIFASSRRKPWSSINFVAAHDGMTTNDLCTYNSKYNLANGEDNRDGTDNNRSWNCGVEGPTTDSNVLVLRARQRRNLLLTMIASQGVPMLLAGDEVGHTQHGNNNAYCQDNELSWIDWSDADHNLFEFVRAAIALRKDTPALRSVEWLRDGADATWLGVDGQPMTPERWNDPSTAGVQLLLDGAVLIINAGPHDATFALPDGSWVPRLSTDERFVVDGQATMKLEVISRSLTICTPPL